MRIDFSKFLRCFLCRFVFTVVLLSQYIRRNDKATVSARMSLVCLAHRLYHCTVSSVFVLTLFEQIKMMMMKKEREREIDLPNKLTTLTNFGNEYNGGLPD